MLLPWFNKYVSTDFHELNIDWLCTAYKDFIEQLQAFDNRLTGIETNVDTRLTAMEGRIDDQDQTIADFKEEVNTRFRELADSIAQQFTDLETEFNGKFDDLEQSINDQFTQLSGDIDERITQFENDITGRLDDFEEAIDARMDIAEDNIIALQDTDKQIKSSMLTQGLLNLYPQEEKTYFPDHSADIVVNMVGGKISAEGTASEDLTVTLAGGPNEIPYGWNTSYDTLFNYRFMRAGVVGSQTLTVDVILYVGGVESRRSTFTGGGAITIMEAEMATLSGIEIRATAAAGVTYNANYIPYIIPMAIGTNISNLQPTTFPELIGRVGSTLIKINANNVDADKMQGRNIWMVNMTEDTFDNVDGVSIGVGYSGISLSGTAAADIDYDTSIKLTPDTSKIYHLLFHTDIGSTAVKFKLHNADDSFVKIYDPATLYEEQFASGDQLTLALLIPAGTYNYQDDIYYPSCSTISSNLELMEDVDDLTDRVEDIEDQLMGETTYGPADEVTFTDPVGDVPLKEVIAYIDPVQDLHGYDYPWPEGGNKNLIDVNDGSYSAGDALWSGSLTLAAGTYTLSSSNTASQVAVLGIGSGTMPYTFTLDTDTTITGIQAVQAGTFNNVQLEAGSSPTSFVPYSNICNIAGCSSIELVRNGKNLSPTQPISHTATNYGVIAIYLKKGTYTASYTGGSSQFYIRTAQPGDTSITSGTEISHSSSLTNVYTFTVPSDGLYKIQLYRSSGSPWSGVASPSNFQVELGSHNTDYEAYVTDSYIVNFGDTYYLCELNITTGELEIKGWYDSFTQATLYGNYGPENKPLYYIDTSNPNIIPAGNKNQAGKLFCNYFRKTTGNTSLLLGNHEIRTQEAANSNKIFFRWDEADLTTINNKFAIEPLEVVLELETPTIIQLTPIEVKTLINNVMWLDVGQVEVTTQSFIESLVEKFTERFIITYDSVAGTVDKTYNEIFEAYVEGRRLCFYDGINITELNQYDEQNGAFHWEYNEFTASGIDFYEMIIDINGVTVNSKSVTI